MRNFNETKLCLFVQKKDVTHSGFQEVCDPPNTPPSHNPVFDIESNHDTEDLGIFPSLETRFLYTLCVMVCKTFVNGKEKEYRDTLNGFRKTIFFCHFNAYFSAIPWRPTHFIVRYAFSLWQKLFYSGLFLLFYSF